MNRSLVTALASLLVAVTARADGEPTTATCPVEFERSYAMFDQFEYDTGWLGLDPIANPDDLGIGMRIFVHGAGEVRTFLPGQARLTDGEQHLELTWEGDEGQGELELDVGVLMAGKFAYNLGLFGSGITDLPLVPNFDFLFYDLQHFTPFLLDGAAEDPVTASEIIEEAEIYTLDIVEVLTGVNIPGLGGGIIIYAGGDVSATLSGTRMTTTPDGVQETIVHEAEGQVGAWPGGPTGSESGQAVYEADIALTGTIDLTPTAFLEIPFFGTWEIIDVTIPIELVNLQTVWEYDPQPLSFDTSGFGVDPADTDSPDGDGGPEMGDFGTDSGGCGCAAAGGTARSGLLSAFIRLQVPNRQARRAMTSGGRGR
jgi:hypothetical protein